MIFETVSAVMFALAGVVVSEQKLPPVPPPPPPPSDPRVNPVVAVSSRTTLELWDASEITCEGGKVLSPSAIPTRIPQIRRPSLRTESSHSFTFRITASGRTLDVQRVREAGSAVRDIASDLAPSLAAARFEPSAKDRECAVTFTARYVPMVEANLEDLMLLRIHTRQARIPQEAWERFVSGDCSKLRARALERHYPDFRAIKRKAGARHWSMVSYDIDEQGVPRNLRRVGGSGSDALDEATREAVAAGRYIDEPRTGCWRYFWQSPDVIAAPERPDMKSYGDAPDACDAKDRWAREPRLNYPDLYQRRAIEGWAVLRYDVAPWGEIGNAEVIEAQPTEEFGLRGLSTLKSARFKPLEGGLSGCIERVVFRLSKRPSSEGADD